MPEIEDFCCCEAQALFEWVVNCIMIPDFSGYNSITDISSVFRESKCIENYTFNKPDDNVIELRALDSYNEQCNTVYMMMVSYNDAVYYTIQYDVPNNTSSVPSVVGEGIEFSTVGQLTNDACYDGCDDVLFKFKITYFPEGSILSYSLYDPIPCFISYMSGGTGLETESIAWVNYFNDNINSIGLPNTLISAGYADEIITITIKRYLPILLYYLELPLVDLCSVLGKLCTQAAEVGDAAYEIISQGTNECTQCQPAFTLDNPFAGCCYSPTLFSSIVKQILKTTFELLPVDTIDNTIKLMKIGNYDQSIESALLYNDLYYLVIYLLVVKRQSLCSELPMSNYITNDEIRCWKDYFFCREIDITCLLKQLEIYESESF